MPDIKSVTIQMINTGTAKLRRYDVQYYSGTSRLYGIPPDTVTKFIEENSREYHTLTLSTSGGRKMEACRRRVRGT